MGNEKEKNDILLEIYNDVRELKELVIRQNYITCNTTSEYVDIETMCRSLKISKETLRRYRKQGLIPYHRIKGKVYFVQSEVKDALKKHYYGSKNSK